MFSLLLKDLISDLYLQDAYAECHKLRYATEEPGKAQGWDGMGIVKGYRTPGDNIRGKFVLSRNPGYNTKRLPCG